MARFSLQLSKPLTVSSVDVQVFDALGRQLRHWPIQASEWTHSGLTIDLRSFPKGLYLIRLRMGEKQMTRKVLTQDGFAS